MFDLDELIEACQQAMDDPQPRLAVREVLERAMSRPGEVADALPATRAEIVPLFVTDRLSIQKVVWAPGMRRPPHNHLMWAAIGLYGGQEDNAFYRRAGGGIVASGGRALRTGDVALLGDDAIHAVTNPLRSFTGAIHVYGGDIANREGRSEWDDATLAEAPYDYAATRAAFEAANEPGSPA